MATQPNLAGPGAVVDPTLAGFNNPGDWTAFDGYSSLRINGVEQLRATGGANTVNYLNIMGGAAGAAVRLDAVGADTNIGVDIRGKGSASIVLGAHRANYLSIQPSATAAGPRIVATGSDADIPISVIPKGTGALIAAFPDNGITGGNARGQNAVDWQTTRGTNTQIASGNYSTISGGRANAATGTDATVSGGNNSSAATGGTVGGGTQNNADGNHAWIPGGLRANTRGTLGRGSWASGYFTVSGDAQAGEAVLRRQTTDATVTSLTSDAGTASTTNQLVIPDSSTAVVRVLVVAREMATNAVAGWDKSILLKRGSGVASVETRGTITTVAPDWGDAAPLAGWKLSVGPDTTNGGLSVSVTGEAGKTIKWVARLMIVEVVG